MSLKHVKGYTKPHKDLKKEMAEALNDVKRKANILKISKILGNPRGIELDNSKLSELISNS